MTELILDEREGLASASGGERLYNCPDSRNAERQVAKDFPQKESAAIAEQGSVIHLALETSRTEGLDLTEATIVERLDAIRKAAVEEWHVQFGLDAKNTQVGKEERLWVYNPNTGEKVISAKLDVFFINGTHAIALDYKTGFLVATPSFRNAQLKIQALAIVNTYENVSHVRVAIAQCRFRAQYDPCDYDAQDLDAASRELSLVIWRSQQPNPPRFAGTWCRYCRASQAADCREAAAWSMIPLAQTAPAELTKSDAIDKVNRMGVQELAFIQSRASLTRNILDAVNDRLKTFENDALATVGLEKSKPGKLRSVTDFQHLFELLFKAELTTLDEFKTWVTVGIGDMEKVIIKRMAEKLGITQKAAAPILATLIEPALAFTPSEPRLKQLKN